MPSRGGIELQPLREAQTVAMADEVKIPIQEEGHPVVSVTVVEAVPTHEDPSQAPTTPSSSETEAPRPASAAAEQIKTSSAENEDGGTAEGKRDVQLGAVVFFLSFALMLPGFSFSSAESSNGYQNWRIDILMLFEFASGICGLSFMCLSMQLLGAPPEVRVPYHRIISRCLFYACIVFPALTLLSLLLVMPFKIYLYLGLAIPLLVPVTAGIAHWHMSRRRRAVAGAPDPEADDATAEFQEQQEQMDANLKITGGLMSSSFGGLIGTLAGVHKQQSGDAAAAAAGSHLATHVAVMFMFSTAMVSVVLTFVSMKAMETKNRGLRRCMVGAIGHANVILIILVAISAFSAAFVVLKFYIPTAFVSLAFAAAVHLIIKRCTAAEAGVNVVGEGRGDGGSNVSPNPNANQEEEAETVQLSGWMADIGKQVTAFSLAGIMAFFGSNSEDKKAASMTCMFLLTSAFASGLGLMLLMNFRAGGPAARGGFSVAINILAFSALGMIAAAALAIYSVVVLKS